MRLKVEPFIAQGRFSRILSLAVWELKVHATVFLSMFLMSTFFPRFHAVERTTVIALWLMSLPVSKLWDTVHYYLMELIFILYFFLKEF